MAEPTRNFSSEENGYSRKEVDDYFEETQKIIQELKTKNQKLYRDCVHFAKQLKSIQNSGILDENIQDLKQQNARYSLEIQNLQERISKLSYDAAPDPETEPISQKEPAERAHRHKTHRVLRGFLIFFLVIFILIAIISIAVTAIEHSDSQGFNIRGYYIDNDALPTVAKAGDIVFAEKEDLDDLTPGDVILVDVGSQRTLGILQKAVFSNGQTKYEVSMSKNTYAIVNQSQYLGTAKFRLPGMGDFVTWAVQNAALYYIILVLILALLILGLVMVPCVKKIQRENEGEEE